MSQVVAETTVVQCIMSLLKPEMYIFTSSFGDRSCKIFQVVAWSSYVRCLMLLLGAEIYKVTGSCWNEMFSGSNCS